MEQEPISPQRANGAPRRSSSRAARDTTTLVETSRLHETNRPNVVSDKFPSRCRFGQLENDLERTHSLIPAELARMNGATESSVTSIGALCSRAPRTAFQCGIIRRWRPLMTPLLKPVDFPAAARRHMEDAKLLEANSRLPNAGHLLGFVAECGLKALLTWHGHVTDAEGSPEPKSGFRTHIDQLVIPERLKLLKLFVDGRSGAKYLAMIPNIGAFSDWKPGHRYYSEAALPTSFRAWKAAAHEVGRMLDQALIDGKK